MDEPLPAVARTAALDEAFGLLSAGAPAVLAESGGHAVGVITKLDVLEFIARRAREA
jgi:predicted transcriptional regulator